MSQGTPEQSHPVQKIHVHLIICDQMAPILPDSSLGSSYADLFRNLLSGAAERAHIPIIYDEWDATQGHLPPLRSSADETDTTKHIYLISGSRSDSYGTEPWIEALREYIRQAFKCGMCFLGICFGHQIIANALGGCAQHGPEGFWGGGARAVNICDSSVAKMAGQDHVRLCVVHFDIVTRLPPGATLVGTSPECTNDSYRIGNQVLTFQGHPELSSEFIGKFIDDFCTSSMPEERVKQAKDTLKIPADSSLVADVILRFFLQQ